jgi:hypothetical protein
MPGISSHKTPPGLICHQRAQSNEFLLRAATRTSFLAIRLYAAADAAYYDEQAWPDLLQRFEAQKL